jgi:hypothetical protein
MDTTPRPRRRVLPVAAGLLALALVGVAVGFATGYLQVRPEVPALEVRRDEGVEKLFPGREAVFVFRFRGGLPRCGAKVDRPSGTEVFAVDPKSAVAQGSAPRTPPDEVEGLIALVAPAAKEETYILHLVVSKLKFPEGRRPVGAADNWSQPAKPKSDAARPAGDRGSEAAYVTYLKSPDLQFGQDRNLINGPVGLRGGEPVRVRLWLRFYTPDELATAEPQPGGGG